MATTSAKKWWKNAVVYQIFPKTFCDSNEDGVGDIPGIISKLHFLKDLGIDVIMLGPVFSSPGCDNGYDISDYRAINPELGTMEDMERLISRAKRVGIKIIMEISINSTSDEHEWFKKAISGDEKYRNYYYLRNENDRKRPNNWRSFYGGSAWSKTKNGDYYLHLLGKNQPELNWDNADVYQEFKDIMKFWLDKGVVGFKIDAVNIICKNSIDNGKFTSTIIGKEHYVDTDKSHDILKKMNTDIWSKYKSFVVGEPVLADMDMVVKLSNEKVSELDAAFFFGRIDLERKCCMRFRKRRNIKRLVKLVDIGQQIVDYPVNFLRLGSHEQYVKYFGKDTNNCLKFSKMLSGLNLSLRGLTFISETDGVFDEKVVDDPTSLYTFNMKMIEFRKNSKALSEGTFRRIASQNDVFIFTREAPEERLYLYCNFTALNKSVEFYGDRVIFSNYSIDTANEYILKPYEYRIVASNI